MMVYFLLIPDVGTALLPFDITQANPYLWYQFMSGATSANTASEFASGGNLTGTQLYLPVGDYLPNWATTAGMEVVFIHIQQQQQFYILC